MTERTPQASPPDDKAKNYPTYSWFNVWVTTLTRPSVRTFEMFLQDRYASTQRALLWLFGARFLMVWLPIALVTLLAGKPAIAALLFFPASGVAAVYAITLLVQTLILQWLARRLGGRGSYSQMIYALSMFSAPLVIITSLVGRIGFSLSVFLTLLFVLIYQVVLTGMALRAVNGFGWSRAFAAIGLLAGVYGISLYLIIRIILSLQGSANDLFIVLQLFDGLWTLPIL